MPFRLIEDLAVRGVMPETAAVIGRGAFRAMESSIPEVSSVAWSSIITGSNPGEHGIFGFTDVAAGTYRLSFPNFADLKAKPFWDVEEFGRCVVVNVPSTYPVRPMNGVLISGFVALDLKKAVHPPALLPALSEIGYKIDVDSDKAHKSMDLFLKDLSDTLEARIRAFRHLWESEEWQTFMLVFTGTDRLAHFLWDAYEDESHKYNGAFREHLHRIDEVVGEIVSRMNDGDSLVMLSDHGFELARCEVNVNRVLVEEGYLRFRNQPPQSLADVDEGTKAFALDPARIYVNLEGRYPRGSVKAKDRESVVDQLSDLFTALEVDGERVVERVCRREDIYEGPYTAQGPDLVLVGNSGFDMKASLRATEVHKSSSFAGKHTQKDAFLLVNSSREGVLPESPGVHQVVDIIRELTGRKVHD